TPSRATLPSAARPRRLRAGRSATPSSPGSVTTTSPPPWRPRRPRGAQFRRPPTPSPVARRTARPSPTLTRRTRCAASADSSPAAWTVRVCGRGYTKERQNPGGRAVGRLDDPWDPRVDRGAPRCRYHPLRRGHRLPLGRTRGRLHRGVLPRLPDRGARSGAPFGVRGRDPAADHHGDPGAVGLRDRRRRRRSRVVLAHPDHLGGPPPGHALPGDGHHDHRRGRRRTHPGVRAGATQLSPRTGRRPRLTPPSPTTTPPAR